MSETERLLLWFDNISRDDHPHFNVLRMFVHMCKFVNIDIGETMITLFLETTLDDDPKINSIINFKIEINLRGEILLFRCSRWNGDTKEYYDGGFTDMEIIMLSGFESIKKFKFYAAYSDVGCAIWRY